MSSTEVVELTKDSQIAYTGASCVRVLPAKKKEVDQLRDDRPISLLHLLLLLYYLVLNISRRNKRL